MTGAQATVGALRARVTELEALNAEVHTLRAAAVCAVACILTMMDGKQSEL